MATCKGCRWYSDFIEADDLWEEQGNCNIPAERMPLCMQGFAQRERELVKAAATGCPTFEER